jgi:hypothetical protein
LVLLRVRGELEVSWQLKLDRDNNPIKDCWLSDAGYTVAMVRLPAKRFTVTRPGGQSPFAYTDRREDVRRLIDADVEASSALAGAGRSA